MVNLFQYPWGDLIGVFITLCYVFFLLFLCKTLNEAYTSTIGRDILHIGIGFPGIFVWFLYDTKIGALIPPLFATILLIFFPKTLKQSFSKQKERHFGLILYCISVTILTGVYWQNPFRNVSWIGAAAFTTLALGDGLGGLIGQRFGKHTYKIPWVKEKSIEGSLAVGFGAGFGISFAQIVFRATSTLNPILILFGAILAITLEAFSPKHSDNICLPFGIAIFYSLLFM